MPLDAVYLYHLYTLFRDSKNSENLLMNIVRRYPKAYQNEGAYHSIVAFRHCYTRKTLHCTQFNSR